MAERAAHILLECFLATDALTLARISAAKVNASGDIYATCNFQLRYFKNFVRIFVYQFDMRCFQGGLYQWRKCFVLSLKVGKHGGFLANFTATCYTSTFYFPNPKGYQRKNKLLFRVLLHNMWTYFSLLSQNKYFFKSKNSMSHPTRRGSHLVNVNALIFAFRKYTPQ